MKKLITKIGKKILSTITKISPNFSSKLLFFLRTKKIPNMKNPTTFNEKATYLKLFKYANDKKIIDGADKYQVRKIVEEKGLQTILNELYGVYDSFDEIDFTKIPNKFALKCTHGCAYNIICSDKNKFDEETAQNKVNNWMKEKYGLATTELHYTKIKPRIIIEKYLCDESGKMPIDYKFYCFNGKCKCILVCSERDEKLRLNYFDNDWNELDYGKETWRSTKEIEKPENLQEMINISEKLAEEYPYVRVDLYNDNGKIIFGELTFTPACSCAPYYNDYGNRMLGEFLDLGGEVNEKN